MGKIPPRKNPNPKLSQAARDRRRQIDNARQRYRRQEQRYRREAANLSGKDAEIMQSAADLLAQRQQDLKGIDVRKRLDKNTNELIKDSYNFLSKNNRNDWQRGENIGKLRLSGTVEGHTFYALTEQLWAGAPYEQRLEWVRKAVIDTVRQDPELVAKYGTYPNANQLIEIVSDLVGFELDNDALIESSNDLVMMGAVEKVMAAYG